MMLIAMFLLGQPASAGMEWADHCRPDAVALGQAARDYRGDRFDRSTCREPVYRRGTCEVRVEGEGVSPESPEAVFLVRLRSNAGVYRGYRIRMVRNDTDDLGAGPCLVRGIVKSDGARESGR